MRKEVGLPDPTTTTPPSSVRPVHAGNVDFLRKQAKALLRAYHTNDRTAVLRMASVIPRLRSLALPQKRHGQNVRLSDAQHVIARELGHASWPTMARKLLTPPATKAKP